MKALVTMVLVAAAPAWAGTPPCVARPGKPTPLTADVLTVVPFPYGPMVKERQRMAAARTPAEFAGALAERRALLGACYKWARTQAADLKGDLKLTLDVDSFGVVSAVSVEKSDAAMEKLAGCVEDALRKARLATRYTPRATQLATVLQFRPSEQAVPAKIARPSIPAPTCAPKSCFPVDDSGAPLDKLSLEPLAITDFSETQAKAERKAAWLAEKKAALARKEKPPPEPVEPPAEPKPAPAPFDPKNALEVPAYNLGAYRACWRAALSEDSEKSGMMEAQLEIDEVGAVCSVRFLKTPVKNAKLETCMREAFGELWFDELPAEGRLTLNLSLKLEPLPIRVIDSASTEPEADEALAAGNAQVAIGAYNAMLSADGVSARRCFWLAGALRAEAIRSPWLDQRAYSAALAFAVYAETTTVSSECLAKAWPSLLAVSKQLHRRAQRFPATAPVTSSRFKELVRAAKLPDSNLAELEFLHAETATLAGNADEAAEAYASAAAKDPKAAWAPRARTAAVLAQVKNSAGLAPIKVLTACKNYLEEPQADRACEVLTACKERLGSETKALEKYADLCAAK